MCGPSALDNPCPFIFIPYTGTGMEDGRMRWERRCREYPRGARTCSPKCAVKILDTILPFVLRDLGINLCRLRRTKKNASPHVTRARAFAPVWMKLLTLAWTCTCVGTPKAFHLFFILLLFLLRFATPYRTGTPNQHPSSPCCLPSLSDVPSINHNIRINIPRTSFALRSAPPATMDDPSDPPTLQKLSDKAWVAVVCAK